jgi:tetratricopeptide (TPR) repeat protein
MKVIAITLMLLFSGNVFSHETSPITLEWKKSIENYQAYIVLKDYQKAIAEAEMLLNIDPSSNEAIFYIRYAYNKSSIKNACLG